MGPLRTLVASGELTPSGLVATIRSSSEPLLVELPLDSEPNPLPRGTVDTAPVLHRPPAPHARGAEGHDPDGDVVEFLIKRLFSTVAKPTPTSSYPKYLLFCIRQSGPFNWIGAPVCADARSG